MAVKSMKISVERLLEQEVEEINRDGEEKYVNPFNISEELTYLAGKIDFYEGIQGHDGDLEEAESGIKKDDEDSKKENDDSKQEDEWPWSSVHSKLRLALSEMCVMLDVLQTLNKKRYLILDPIQQTQEHEKQTVQMLEKRKYLAKVGAVIGKGASGLGVKVVAKQEPIVIDGDQPQKEAEYYTQLIELRQFWRVKKSGNQITGDLSYRTSGSRFWHLGLFEVKAHNNEETNSDNTDDEKKTMTIAVSPDLTSKSEITVKLIDESGSIKWKALSVPIILEDNFVNGWEKDMSKAQQHLFNKEIFSQLSNDAFQGSFLGIEVLNSQIKCKLLNNAEVIISHNFEDADSVPSNVEVSENLEISNDLTWLLSALLYQQHRNVSKFSTPYPATSNFYGKQSKSSSVVNLIHRKPNESGKSLLQEFIKQAEHKVWIHRINDFLYLQNSCHLEPTISFHWNVLKSRLKSVLTVTLSTICIHKRISSSFVISVNEDEFHIYGSDASIQIPLDMDMLHLILQNQIYKHLQSVIEVIAKQHGWSMLTTKIGTDMLLPTQVSNAPIVLTSFQENKTIYLYVYDMQNIKVEAFKDLSIETDQLLLDESFKELLKTKFEIPWDCLPGSCFVDKCQSLILFS